MNLKLCRIRMMFLVTNIPLRTVTEFSWMWYSGQHRSEMQDLCFGVCGGISCHSLPSQGNSQLLALCHSSKGTTSGWGTETGAWLLLPSVGWSLNCSKTAKIKTGASVWSISLCVSLVLALKGRVDKQLPGRRRGFGNFVGSWIILTRVFFQVERPWLIWV